MGDKIPTLKKVAEDHLKSKEPPSFEHGCISELKKRADNNNPVSCVPDNHVGGERDKLGRWVAGLRNTLGLELDVRSKEKKMLRVKGKVAIHAIYILQQESPH